jgi:hypothetical protein
MEVQRLVYIGKREEGTLNVGRLDILSPWRKFRYYKGLNFQVGKVVPIDVARILADDYPDHFKIEKMELDERGSHIYHMSDMVEEILASSGDEMALDVIREVIGKYFGDYDLRKKASPKPVKAKTAANTTRRRKK